MKNKKGFTLIEMLIIMIIISILTVIGKVSYDSHAEKTRFTEAYTNVASIINAQKDFYVVNHKFAEDLAELGLDITGTQVAAVSNTGIDGIKTADFIYATYPTTDSYSRDVAVVEVVREQSKTGNTRKIGVCYNLYCTPEGDFKTETGGVIDEGKSRKVARREMEKLKVFFEEKTW